MKNHPSRLFDGFVGMSDTMPADRIDDDKLALLYNGWCDRKGRIRKYPSTYPITMAEAFGLIIGDPSATLWCMESAKSRESDSRAVAVLGSGIYRSGPNNLYDRWQPITFSTDYATPALDRVCDIVFRNRHCYVQNGVDMPFRFAMSEDDGTTASTLADPCGLRPPLVAFKYAGTNTAGTRFFHDSVTQYVVTFVYGDRGESGPSPACYLSLTSSENFDTVNYRYIPLGPAGCTARRIYRTRINTGFEGAVGEADRLQAYRPLRSEFFFLAELGDNTTTTYTDKHDDSKLDFNRRVPPPRPFVPVAKYQVLHQDHFAWANVKDHPWTMGIHHDLGNTSVTTATLTISNTGNGTISYTINGPATVTCDDYKTKTLKEIWIALQSPNYSATLDWDTTGFACLRPAPGLDWDRTYRFREVAARNIYGSENAYWFEAIDDDTDTVIVDGQQKFPARVMWSTVLYPEEVNPLNGVDISRHDAYPVNGLAHDDHTLSVFTQDGIEVLSGSFFSDPQTFRPQFSRARTNAAHGAYCTRPDAVIETPMGLAYIAFDGARLFRGQTSQPYGTDVERRLMERVLKEPRARDNVCLAYFKGRILIAFPGLEVV